MELRHLRYFVAIAEAESFRRAAEKLRLSQPPLSRQMQQLRDEVGVELFTPSGRGVKLTGPGHVLLDRAREVLARIDSAIEEAREAAQGNLGTITIGFEPGTAFFGELYTVISRLRKLHQRLNLQMLPMNSSEQWEALRLEKVLFAYGRHRPTDPSIESVELGRAQLGIAMSKQHRLARKPRLTVKDLATELVLMEPRQSYPQFHDDVIATARAHGVVLKLAPDVVDSEAVWTLVASGIGLTFASEKEAYFLKIGPATWRPMDGLGIDVREIAMWRRANAALPLLRPLVEVVRAVASLSKASEKPRRRTPRRPTRQRAT